MSNLSTSPRTKVNAFRLLALIAVIGAVVATILIGCLSSCTNSQPTAQLELQQYTTPSEDSEEVPEEKSEEKIPSTEDSSGNTPGENSAMPAPEGWSEEEIKAYNNPLIEIMAESYIDDNEVFRQALILATTNMVLAQQGRPLLTEDDLPQDVDNATLISVMHHFVETDDAYRSYITALIFSAMNTKQRQRMAEELKGDPVLEDPEVTQLIPDEFGNYPNYHGLDADQFNSNPSGSTSSQPAPSTPGQTT